MNTRRRDGRDASYPHKYFGVWVDCKSDDYQDLNEAIRNGYELDDRELVASFLANGKTVAVSPVWIDCRYCRQKNIAGRAWRSDGIWLWSSDLPHMLMAHNIALPDEFVQHIRDRGYSAESGDFDCESLDWWPMRPSSDDE